jgi:twinkle protein
MTAKQTHQPCPDCGHNDCLTIFESGNTFCLSCKKSTKAIDVGEAIAQPVQSSPAPTQDFTSTVDYLANADYVAITDRGITSATAKTYKTLYTANKVYFSYFEPEEPNVPIACKVRLPNKQFPISGEWKKAGLFGQHLFSKGGKYVTLVEGEFDALAAYQMQGSKYPCVSIKNGAGSALKDCKEQMEWLDSFDNIVIAFDADKPGQEAAKEVAELFGGKAKIVKHIEGCKDACDYLKQGKASEFTNAFWRAETYVPEGIIKASDLMEELKKPKQESLFEYPFEELNKLTYGVRQGELVTIGAGTGVGKSQFVKELVKACLDQSDANIGLLSREEGNPVTIEGLMSLYANKILHKPDSVYTDEEYDKAMKEVMKDDRIYLFNHWGSASSDTVISQIRYMAKALDCKLVVLDHVSIVVSAQLEGGDERKTIDALMTKLRMLVEETGIALVCVTHLNRPSTGKPHEEGGHTSLVQFRGSGSIAQLSNICIGLERDGQHEDAYQRNLTTPRVLKNRFVGLTGACNPVYYNTLTGRMAEEPMEAI